MAVTDWVQPDPFNTRERFNLRSFTKAVGQDFNGISAPTPIPVDTYVAETYNRHFRRLSLNGTSMALAQQQAQYAESERWLDTPGALPGWLYEASLWAGSSGSHVHDFDAGEWQWQTAVAQRNAFVAANPNATNVRFVWEGFPSASQLPLPGLFEQQFGAVTDRVLEVTTVVYEAQANGNRTSPSWQTFDPDSDFDTTIVALTPNQAPPQPAQDDEDEDGAGVRVGWSAAWADQPKPYVAPWDTTTGVGSSSNMELLTGTLALNEMVQDAGVGVVLGSVPAAPVGLPQTTRIDINDGVFDALAWDLARDDALSSSIGDVGWVTRGIPLAFGPAYAVNGAEHLVYSGDEQKIVRTAAEVWFESLFTPPRWRIEYDAPPGQPPCVRYPHGATAANAARRYPPITVRQRSNRKSHPY